MPPIYIENVDLKPHSQVFSFLTNATTIIISRISGKSKYGRERDISCSLRKLRVLKMKLEHQQQMAHTQKNTFGDFLLCARNCLAMDDNEIFLAIETVKILSLQIFFHFFSLFVKKREKLKMKNHAVT